MWWLYKYVALMLGSNEEKKYDLGLSMANF